MTEEKKIALSCYINKTLASSDICVQHLPLDPLSDDLYDRLGDGFLLSGLVNAAAPGAVHDRALLRDVTTAYGEAPLTDEQRRENLVTVLTAAKDSLGLVELAEVSPDLFMACSDHTGALDVMWSVVSAGVLKNITIQHWPELVLLLEDDEEMDSMLLMTAEEVLSRWVNYHLVKADDYRRRRLEDWAQDLADSECYALLLKQLMGIAGTVADPALLEFGYTCRLSVEDKAEAILVAAAMLGVEPILSAQNITSGHVDLNVLFVGQLFNAVSGLSLNHHVREHVKESINELIVIQQEEEEQERQEIERQQREEREQKELEIALEKEKQFRELMAEEERVMEEKRAEEERLAREQEAELALALEKERQHRELEAEEERAQQLREQEREKEREKERVRAEAEAQAHLAKQRQEEKEQREQEKVAIAKKQLEEQQSVSKQGSTDSSDNKESVESQSNQLPVVRVVEEAWENQTYLPVRGWGAPRSTVHPFSDKSGSKKITFEKYPALAGWEWLSQESDEWQVDHSGAFGETDDEGWCYDSSFEKILEGIRLGATSGENKTTNLTRRRRLLRTRVCTTSQALEEHHSHVAYLTKEKSSLEHALAARQTEFDKLGQYEAERVELQGASRDTLLASVTVSHESFLAFKGELKKLQEFLIAQAAAEFQYAECLEAQHKAYYPSTGTEQEDESDSPRKRATTTELVSKTLEYLSVKDDSATNLSSEHEQDTNVVAANVRKASFQFFTGFSDFNRSSANKYRDFGNFILDSVLGDVQVLIAEVDEAIINAKHHLKFVEENKSLEAQLSQAYSSAQKSFAFGIRKGQIKLNTLKSRIRGDVYEHSEPAGGKPAGDVEISSGATTSSETSTMSSKIDDSDMLDESSGRGSLSSSILSSDFNFRPSSVSGGNDTHILLSKYKDLAQTFTEHLQRLQHAAVACSAQATDFSLKIRQIFVISMQLCCHEKSKICSYNAELMKQTSSNFQLWNNAVNVKEFQVQEQKEVEQVRRKSLTMTALPPTIELEINSEECSQEDDNEQQKLNINTDSAPVSGSSELDIDVEVCVVPSAPLAPLGSEQVVLQANMQFTTFRDAKRIVHGELDGSVAPTVVSDTSGTQVHFSGKGGSWMKRVDEAVSSTSGTTSSTNAGSSSSVPAPEKVSTRSRFTRFFSSKSKPTDTTGEVETETEGQNEGEGRKNVAETRDDVLDESVHEESHVEGASLYEAQATVSAEGVLHLYGAGGAGGQPLKSLMLEDCHVIFHDKQGSKHLSNAIEIYPKKQVGGKRIADGFVLLPPDEVVAREWVTLLCSPACGAVLLVPLAGMDLEVASYDDTVQSSGGDEVDSSFIAYDPDAVKPSLL
mmetsp:Transcript_34981/g.65293  ORF Transcript_34981/g.65293 Transcript_34981/m.65293 type:complete len:1347 (+) Transcript_34981:117-4157(+)